MCYRNRCAWMTLLPLFAFMLALAVNRGARCEQPATKAAAEEEKDDETHPITRVYDVRDLVFTLDKSEPSTIVPPTRLGQRPPLPTQPKTSSTQPAASTSVDEDTPESLANQVVDLVRETVDPDSWRDNGGAVGSIRTLRGVLIVTQSAENHRQIASLFEQLRETRARHVTVQARWVALSPANVKAIAKPLKDDPTLFGVDLAALDRLAAKDAPQWYGQLTFFNGLTVRINSGRARTVITDPAPVRGGGGSSGSSLVQAGLLLDVTAVLNPEGTRAMLNLQSVASDWQDPSGATTRPTARQADIDRIEVVVQQMRTSIALPSGQPVLVGGMTLDPGDHADGGDAPRQLYLIIEASGTKGE